MERPILFTGPMVRAILAGTKTVTRRILRPDQAATADQWAAGSTDEGPRRLLRRCPYGAPGDRLWVRETWAGDDLCGFLYRADHPTADLSRGDLDDGEQTIRRWHPSIHMPRAGSRITLEIVSVRVERLQDITEDDALSEGCEHPTVTAYTAFAGLWDAINGKRAPWASNPWVWRIEFRRLEASDGR